MNITLHQLKVFREVANQQSVTKAAEALHMTQPAVSNIIRLLEDTLGTPLIEIIKKRLYLTPSGELVASLFDKIDTEIQGTLSEIHLLQGEMKGTLKIATVSTAKYFVPRLLGAFKTLYPQIHIELKVKNRQEVIQRLEQNSDDFVIMSQLPDPQYESHVFYRDELVVAASTLHPLAQKQNITFQALEAEPWLIREKGSGTRIAMEKIIKEHAIQPKIEMEIDNNESIKQAIIGNIGISILSHHSMVLEEKMGLMTSLNVVDFPISHRWYLVKNKAKKLPVIAKAFYDFVCNHPNLETFKTPAVQTHLTT